MFVYGGVPSGLHLQIKVDPWDMEEPLNSAPVSGG